jgi:hypothetical protein
MVIVDEIAGTNSLSRPDSRRRTLGLRYLPLAGNPVGGSGDPRVQTTFLTGKRLEAAVPVRKLSSSFAFGPALRMAKLSPTKAAECRFLPDGDERWAEHPLNFTKAEVSDDFASFGAWKDASPA